MLLVYLILNFLKWLKQFLYFSTLLINTFEFFTIFELNTFEYQLRLSFKYTSQKWPKHFKSQFRLLKLYL